MKTSDGYGNYGPYGVRSYKGRTITKGYIPGGRLGTGYAYYTASGLTGSFRQLKQAKADAALIAAAPSLLAAGRSLEQWAEQMGGWDAPCWAELRAAIAQTEGRT